MDNFFCFENRLKSVLKDMAVYALTLLSFWNVVYIDFQSQGLIFKNCKFSKWHKKLYSQKVQTFLLNSWFDASNNHL